MDEVSPSQKWFISFQLMCIVFVPWTLKKEDVIVEKMIYYLWHLLWIFLHCHRNKIHWALANIDNGSWRWTLERIYLWWCRWGDTRHATFHPPSSFLDGKDSLDESIDSSWLENSYDQLDMDWVFVFPSSLGCIVDL